MRPTKEEYYMAISQIASLRSTCLSRKVGAVIVKDDNPISFGFNGPARGVEHCEDLGGCRRRAMVLLLTLNKMQLLLLQDMEYLQ